MSILLLYAVKVMGLQSTCYAKTSPETNRDQLSTSPHHTYQFFPMSQPQGPSLLEYARFHGIATNQTTINPLEYIDQILETSNHEDTFTSGNHLSTTQAAIEQDLRGEKLNVNKNDARFLSTVVRSARAEHVDVNWDEYLPSMRRMEGLKAELPALTTHHETDMASLRKHTVFGRGGAASSLLKGCSPYPMEDCSGDIVKMGEEVVKRIRMERLNCTKGSLIMIQNARRCGDGLSLNMESYFDTLLGPYQVCPLLNTSLYVC